MHSRERNTRKFEPLQNLFALNGMLMNMSSRNLVHTILMIPSSGETQSAGYWLEKGNELCNSGQMEEAIKAYEFALSLDATLIDAWNNKGLILANQNRLDEALQCFDEVLKISPRHAYTLSNKGMVLAQQKKYQDALDCFEAAIVVDPYFAGAWYNKALAMQCLGRGREAMAAMKTADKLEGKAGGCRRRC
jgi:tetratricopeptide (TPR) repeat protein